METKANYAIVGFFTVLVIAAAFGFVYWMSQYGRTGQMVELVVNIPGSANGLSVGSPVRFNGINVGSVRNLAIDANDPRYSIAITEVSADAPVMKSTTATLEVQGLTGAAYIELSGGRKGDENILKTALEK
ncbi:MlaD family protein, partial [Sinorhizobium meliloti]